MRDIEEKEEEIVKFEWPQAYYLPTDGEIRKRALDKAVAKGLEPKRNKIRQELWERRYNTPTGVDNFLAGYMNLSYYASVVKSNLMAKFHKKDIKKTQELLCYDIIDKYGADGEDMLYLELYHMLDYYIDICLRDKKYGGIIMGIGTLKKASLINKISNDLFKTSYGLSPEFEIAPAHKLFQKAAKQCFFNRYPNSEKWS